MATNPSAGMLHYFASLEQLEKQINQRHTLPFSLQSYNLDPKVTSDQVLYSAHEKVQDYHRAYMSLINDVEQFSTFLNNVARMLHQNAQQAHQAFMLEHQHHHHGGSAVLLVRYTLRESAVAAHREFCEMWKPFREFRQELYKRETYISSALDDLNAEVGRREDAFGYHVEQ